MLPIAAQILAVLIMIATGFIVGFLFDVYRVIRTLLRPKRHKSILLDLGFWLLVTPILFFLLVSCNHGQLRLYVFLGLALGLFCYFELLSETVLWLLIRSFRVLIRRVMMSVSALLRLFVLPRGLVSGLSRRTGWRRGRRRRGFFTILHWRPLFRR